MAITALCMLVLVGWQWYNASKHPTVQPDTTVATDRHATPPSDVTSTHNDPAQTNADNTQTAQNPQKQPAQQTALAPDNAWHVKDNAHLPAVSLRISLLLPGGRVPGPARPSMPGVYHAAGSLRVTST